MNSNKNISIIFMGTSEFSVPILVMLQKEEYNIKAVVTQPDKKNGRGYLITEPPVKQKANELKLKILQPNTLKNKDSVNEILNLNPDVIIVVSYGQILPQSIINYPKYGCINIHASILPKYRGASPIESVLLNNEEKTGVTIMLMDTKVDHGPVIHTEIISIKNNETYISLSSKLSKLGAKALKSSLNKYIKGNIKPKEQNHNSATFTKLLSKESGHIQWNKNANEINNQINAYVRWPGSYTFWNNKRLKIISAQVINKKSKHKTGICFEYNKNLAVACKDSILILNIVQLEGKNEVSSSDFIKGYQKIIGEKLK